MLNVSYENRIGYYTRTWNGNDYKVWFCHANCLCAEVHFYKDENDRDMVSLQGFYADIQHLKNCLKDKSLKLYEDCKDFHFYAKELDKDLWKMIKIMTENGIKVTIE